MKEMFYFQSFAALLKSHPHSTLYFTAAGMVLAVGR
jgi:hypothetical protein